MRIAPSIQKLIEQFERLPGIGPKTAERLTFYLLHTPQSFLEEFAASLENLKKLTKICSICFNVSESDPCPICSDRQRDHEVICVVEQPLDILALEKGGFFRGTYHVLHGVIDPLNNILPEQLYIPQLVSRVKNDTINELIIATDPTVEGEATAMYIQQFLAREPNLLGLKITRIGRGLPTGADIEYADEQTLARAFEGRKEY
jgi:recombination protein RecR